MAPVGVGKNVPQSPGEVLTWPFCCGQTAPGAAVRHLVCVCVCDSVRECVFSPSEVLAVKHKIYLLYFYGIEKPKTNKESSEKI